MISFFPLAPVKKFHDLMNSRWKNCKEVSFYSIINCKVWLVFKKRCLGSARNWRIQRSLTQAGVKHQSSGSARNSRCSFRNALLDYNGTRPNFIFTQGTLCWQIMHVFRFCLKLKTPWQNLRIRWNCGIVTSLLHHRKIYLLVSFKNWMLQFFSQVP